MGGRTLSGATPLKKKSTFVGGVTLPLSANAQKKKSKKKEALTDTLNTAVARPWAVLATLALDSVVVVFFCSRGSHPRAFFF